MQIEVLRRKTPGSVAHPPQTLTVALTLLDPDPDPEHDLDQIGRVFNRAED